MELNKPLTVNYIGEITNVSDAITKNGSTFCMVTLKIGSTYVSKPINESFYSKRSNDFSVGNHVNLTFEQRIADTTEYVNKAGEVQKHKSTSEGVSGILVQKQGDNVFSEATKAKMQFAAELGLTIKL